MRRRVGAAWAALKNLYQFCLPIRFSFLALGMLIFAFWFSDQGSDILRALLEDRGRMWGLRYALALVALNLLGLAVWYASRHMLRYRPLDDPNDEQTALREMDPRPALSANPRTAEWTPRWLGLAVYAIVFVGLLLVVIGYWRRHCCATDPLRAGLALGCVALTGVLYWLFVVRRRRHLGYSREEMTEPYHTFADLVRATRSVFIITIVLELFLFVVTLVNPVWWRYLGVAAVLMLTIAVWVPLGSAIVAIGEAWRFPILGVLLFWAFVISPLADNHDIRTLPRSNAVAARPGLERAISAWETRVREDGHVPAGAPVPMFVVATEGGGIRAAYWTATVLATLHDLVPGFADHCFAISGVSGGALGGVVFDALLAQRSSRGATAATMHEDVHEVLGFDALSGTLASMAQPDLVQRFVPLPLFPDRAEALERGWEGGWKRRFHGDATFEHGLLAMLQANPRLPSLFLNGTVVETGDRIITSNVAFRDSLSFRNAVDAFGELSSDIRLSTAATMSARFTYVSPAGKIPSHGDCSKLFGHVVDGGYFENSGSVTALEIVDQVLTSHPGIRPMVIVIDFSDEAPSAQPWFCPAPGLPGPKAPKKPEKFANEVMSPLRALLATRGAHGTDALGKLLQRLGDPAVAEFRLAPHCIPIPLGWVLSDRAKDEIDAAIDSTQGNRTAVHRVAAHLGLTLSPAWKDRYTETERAASTSRGCGRVPPAIGSQPTPAPDCRQAIDQKEETD